MPVRLDRQTLLIALLLAVLACGLRFYRLGTWSFAHDELATLDEDAAFFGGASAPLASQTARLPRLVPVSYLLLHLGYQAFGRDERGARVVPALFGAASVVLVFLLLDGLLGTTVALAAAALVMLWPEHLFRSQDNRFYVIAMFFAAACLLFGARALERRSTRDAVASSLAGLLALLSHTVSVAALLIAAAGLLVSSLVRRERLPTRVLLPFGLGLLVALLFGAIVLAPLARGWNAGETWGYSLGHTILSSVNMVGWPVAILSATGLLFMAWRRGAQDLYWMTAFAGWVLATLVLPKLVAYHPGYVFPLALGALVPAAIAIDRFAEALRPQGRRLALACVALLCLLNLPGVASYYVDGSRPDWRTAAQFVQKRWRPPDRVTSFAQAFIRYYAPECTPVIPLPLDQPVASLERLVSQPGRLWVVLSSSRVGLEPDLKTWLRHRCSCESEFVKTRYDYSENRVEVYQCAGL